MTIMFADQKSAPQSAAVKTVVRLPLTTFATWVQKRRRARGPEAVPAPKSAAEQTRRRGHSVVRLVEAVLEARPEKVAAVPSGRSVLSVELPGGARLEVSETGQAVLLAQVLRALAQESC